MAEEISPREAAALTATGAVLVDIREAEERASGCIPGARHAPLSTMSDGDFDAVGAGPVIFHCRSGRRTAMNADQLTRKAGVDAVYILSGGIDAWRAEGLPIEEG